jgi:hypothetical protein
MKVRCKHIFNDQTQQYEKMNSWLTIEKDYIVLAVVVRKDSTSFLIVSDSNGKPVLQNASQFEVLTKKIPSNWQITAGDLELLVLEPKSWGEPGFWQDCYEHDPKAMEMYKREASVIFAEENL